MRKYVIIGVVIAIVVLGLATWGLYSLGDIDQSALERLRDIAIIYLVLLWVVAFVILVGIAGGVLWLVLTTKDKIVPALDKLTETAGTLADTAKRVKATTEFVTEEVAAPIISFYGTIAKGRALAKTLTSREKPDRKTFTKLLKK